MATLGWICVYAIYAAGSVTLNVGLAYLLLDNFKNAKVKLTLMSLG